MPKGHHYGRTQTRAYTGEYHSINANIFKPLLTKPLGKYTVSSDYLSDNHRLIILKENKNGVRYITSTINYKKHQIGFILDKRSVRKKIYINSPYCNKQPQNI